MRDHLAVFAMQLRAVSETFIQRHFKDVAPGKTVAVCRLTGADGEDPCPAFLADQWALQLPVRLACRVGADRQRLLHAAIARFLRQHGQVGHVLGEYLHQFVDFVPMLDAMGVPYVVQGHGLDLSSSIKSGGVGDRYLAYGTAKAVLTRCEFHRQRLISMGLAADNIHVNPGGVDIPAAIPPRAPAASKRFLAIGRMVPQKAPILLLEAFRLAASQDPELTSTSSAAASRSRRRARVRAGLRAGRLGSACTAWRRKPISTGCSPSAASSFSTA